ncbi:MAG: acyl-CoA dehydrogenase family protein [Myxococcota bacterium]
MIPRTLFDEEHDMFRRSVRRFVEQEIVPHHPAWEAAGVVPRELWHMAGELGLLCPDAPEAYGGPGANYLYNVIVTEELLRVGATGPGFLLHSDIVLPYIAHHGTEGQKEHWIPKMVSGEVVTAIAMSEPGAGSDLQGISTRALEDGADFVLNGAKTFITNGQLCDLVIVAAKTDPSLGAGGISLFLVEADRPGFQRGTNLDKVGMKAQDTSELFFEDVRVPRSALLGPLGGGFALLMQELAQERLAVAVMTMASAQAALDWTVEYVNERRAFGKPIAKFQNTRFKLADLAATLMVGRTFVDRCLALHLEGELDIPTAAAAKLWTSETQFEVMDTCLQLFGGYGYMSEYPISRAWTDARIQRIWGGTSEIMRELVARSLLDGEGR